MNKNILRAVLSGLLLWAAWPPTPYSTFLLFIGLVPLLLALEDIMQSSSGNKGKRIFWTSFLGFFIWNTLCIYWVYNSLKMIGEVIAVPLSLIPYSLGPLLMSTACWLYYKLRYITSPLKSLAGLVAFWIAYEFLHQSWDLSFPWMNLGNGFAVSHQWVQWYEYTGVYGGTLWVLAVNILFFLAYTSYRHADKSYKLFGGAALLLIALPIGISLGMYSSYEEQQNPANVVVVQPNVDPYAKYGSEPVSAQLENLIQLSDSLGQPNTEYFIWPETAIPANVNEELIRSNPYYIRIQEFLDKYKNANVLSGIESYKVYNYEATASSRATNNPNEYYDAFNAAVNIENSAMVQFHHKSKLVPGAEQMPFGSALSFLKPVFAQLGGSSGSYGKQDEPEVFYSQNGIGAAPVICFESIWGGYVGQYIEKGAQFIAVITNDGWWENTSGKDQHLDYAKLRAIETRRWVCRSANTGISAFINQRGDITQKTSWWKKDALKADINLNSEITFYVKYGDFIAWIGSIITILVVVWLIFSKSLEKFFYKKQQI
jgi:apolipoprotein N-acyltransferase